MNFGGKNFIGKNAGSVVEKGNSGADKKLARTGMQKRGRKGRLTGVQQRREVIQVRKINRESFIPSERTVEGGETRQRVLGIPGKS